MEFVRTGSLQLLWSTFLLIGILGVAGRFGGFFLSFCGIKKGRMSTSEGLLFSIGCGIPFLALGILAVGVAGCLNRVCVGILLAVLFVCPFLFQSGNLFEPFGISVKIRAADLPLICLLALPLLLSWLQTSLPPTGNDALAYHLAHPKEFILDGKIHYLKYTRESLWPYLTEMLFTLGLLIDGTILAQLFHWFFYPFCGYAIFCFTDRFYGRWTATMAAIFFLFTPAAFAQASQAYVDLSLAFYVFCSLYAFLLVDDLGETESALLSGILAGAVLSIKYLGLGCAAILFIFWLLKRRTAFKPVGIFLFTAAAVSCVWYLRSWVILSNPVYPFFHSVFGGGYPLDLSQGVGIGNGPVAFVSLLWNLAMHPEPFGGEMIGPFYLMGLPLLIFSYGSARAQDLYFAWFTFLWTLFIFTQSQQARFFLAACPLWAVGASVTFTRLLKQRKAVRGVALAAIFCVCLVHGGIFMYRSADVWFLLSRKEKVETYLTAKERSFRGNNYLRLKLRPGEAVFNIAEARSFYGPPLSQVSFPEYDFLRPMEGLRTSLSQTLADYLDMKNFRYFWVDQNPRASPQFKEYLGKRNYEKVFAYSFREEENSWEYCVYRARS